VDVPEVISSAFLQQLVDARALPKRGEDRRQRALILSVGACADALATAEDDLPKPIRELRSVLDQYVALFEENDELVMRLIEAVVNASPLLDAEAKKRAAEITTAKRPSTKARLARAWGPQAIQAAPRELARSLKTHLPIVHKVRRLLHDLTRPAAHALVKVGQNVSPKIRIAKFLKSGGFTVAEITTVTEPQRASGAARRQARNAVTKRLLSKNVVSMGFTIPNDPALSRRLEMETAALLRTRHPTERRAKPPTRKRHRSR
jgi:hypothetical protein